MRRRLLNLLTAPVAADSVGGASYGEAMSSAVLSAPSGPVEMTFGGDDPAEGLYTYGRPHGSSKFWRLAYGPSHLGDLSGRSTNARSPSATVG